MRLTMSALPKTWIFDLDGTLVVHNGYKMGGDKLLPGVKEFMVKIPISDYILIITSRRREEEAGTVDFLNREGIRFNKIWFEMPMGERILFNDDKTSGLPMAYSVRHKRNVGLKDVDVIIDETL